MSGNGKETMFKRFYRAENPGGGSGASASGPNASVGAPDASSANQPGAQGGDKDPVKSTVSAAGDAGSGTENSPQQQAKPPATLEEALKILNEKETLLTDATKRLKETEDVLAHKKKSFQSKGRELNALRRQLVDGDGAEIKPRGGDGKYTAKDLEEINQRAYSKVQREVELQQATAKMEEYISEFAESQGIGADEVKRADDLVTKYRRQFALLEDEKDDSPIASELEQVEMFEFLLKGIGHDKIVEKRVAEAVAQRDNYWKAKIGDGGAPEGGSLAQKTLLDGGAEQRVSSNPVLNEMAASIKRIKQGAGV